MNGHYEHADPERYGFEFGKARVTRMAHVEGRYHVIGLDTPYRHVQVGVSPTGRSVRVWIDGAEIQSGTPSGSAALPADSQPVGRGQ